MPRRHRNLAAIFGLALASAALPATGASAQTVDAAIEAWVANLDARPDLAVRYDALEVSGGTAVIQGLSIVDAATQNGALFTTVAITGYQPMPPNGFAADTITIDRVQARTGEVQFRIVDVAFTDLKLPETGFTFDPEQPFTSVIGMFGLAADMTLGEARIGRIDLLDAANPEDVLVSYQDYVVSGLAEGRIESFSAGPMVMATPVEDETFSIIIDRVSSEGIDFGAMVGVLDPATYAGGPADRTWRTVLEHARYDNIVIAGPDVQLRVRAMEVEDFRMRASEQPLTGLLDLAMTWAPSSSPEVAANLEEQMASSFVDLLSQYGFGRFSVEGLDIYSGDFDRFHLGEFHIADLSLDGLGEIGFSDLDVVVGGEGWATLDRFAIGGIAFPDEALLRSAILVGIEGIDPTALVPTLEYIEAEGLAFAASGQLPIALDRAQLQLGGHLGPYPTEVQLDIEGLRAPLSLAGEDLAVLAQLGITQLELDFGLDVSWEEATETLSVNDLTLRIAEAGSISASAELTGITRKMLENSQEMEDNAENIRLSGLRLTAVDEAFVDRVFRWAAEGDELPVEEFRERFIRTLPLLIGLSLGDTLAEAVTPTIQDFLRNPGTLAVVAAPPMPVPLEALMEVIDRAPEQLAELLGLSIVNEPAE